MYDLKWKNKETFDVIVESNKELFNDWYDNRRYVLKLVSEHYHYGENKEVDVLYSKYLEKKYGKELIKFKHFIEECNNEICRFDDVSNEIVANPKTALKFRMLIEVDPINMRELIYAGNFGYIWQQNIHLFMEEEIDDNVFLFYTKNGNVQKFIYDGLK
jgi:hypothetical protein